MTDTLQEHADPDLHKGETLVQMKNVGKTYGAIRALRGINLTVSAGEVAGVLHHTARAGARDGGTTRPTSSRP